MGLASVQRARGDIVHYAHRGLGVREYSLSAARAVRRAIPFDGICLMTMDPASALSQATGGRLDRSLRQRELRAPHGFDDELRVALGVGSTTWGGLVLM